MPMPPQIEIQGDTSLETIEFDKNFCESAQLEALVQLRIHQDNVVYSRINALLIMNSMLILAFVPGVKIKPEMAIVIALFGMLVNILLMITLRRQNKVLEYNIKCVNGFWNTSKKMERLWGEIGRDANFFKKLSHARFLLTVIVPFVFLLLWYLAYDFARYESDNPLPWGSIAKYYLNAG